MSTSKSKPRFDSASDFIRSLPLDTPAGEVVKRGKSERLKFSAGLVYAVRSADKKKGRKGGKTAPTGNPKVRLKSLMREVGLRTSFRVLSSLISEAA